MFYRGNKRLNFLILTLFISLVLPGGAGALEREDFERIAEGGFDTPQNNYAFAMAEFNDDIYVGTNRNFIYMIGLLLKQSGLVPPDFELPWVTHPDGDVGELGWAEDMRAEIWRRHLGSWERVYQAPVFDLSLALPVPPGTYFPREPGFRSMAVHDGAIYAAAGAGVVPGNLVVGSADGVLWEHIVTNPLMGTDSRAMAVHNGKLYLGPGPTGQGATLWASAAPSTTTDTWELVADFTPAAPGTNMAVVSLASWNGYLYAGCQNEESGFQVFRSDAQAPDHPAPGGWTQIIAYGGGDMANTRPLTMQVFKDWLIVGSSIFPITGSNPPEIVPPKGFDILRVHPDDTWDLLVGNYFPQKPAPGVSVPRFPLSGWPGGFANFLNFYVWSMEVYDDVLYLGTFDPSSFLPYLTPGVGAGGLAGLTPEDLGGIVYGLDSLVTTGGELGIGSGDFECLERLLLALGPGDPAAIDWQEVWEILVDCFAGADLWKTEDGVFWHPITLNGFDNTDNYGFRNIVKNGPLFVGTANPFSGQSGGLEVWQAPGMVEAIVDFDPDTLNLKSRGRWVTVYIELESPFGVADIDPATVLLNGTVPAETRWASIGDHDGDGIPDLKVKFPRSVLGLAPGDDVEVAISGALTDATPFMGVDIIRVIHPGPAMTSRGRSKKK
jgi:hypothetical protein